MARPLPTAIPAHGRRPRTRLHPRRKKPVSGRSAWRSGITQKPAIRCWCWMARSSQRPTRRRRGDNLLRDLESDTHSDLNTPCIEGAVDAAEVGVVVDAARIRREGDARVVVIDVIEDVEELTPRLQARALAECKRL